MIARLLLLAYLLTPLGGAFWMAWRHARTERLAERMARALSAAGATGIRWRVGRVSLAPGQRVSTTTMEPITPWHEVGEQPTRKEGA